MRRAAEIEPRRRNTAGRWRRGGPTLPKRTILAAVLAAGISLVARAQFYNLDFEQVQLIPAPGDPYGRVQFGPAFPGWTGYCGSTVQTAANYNTEFLSSAGISILDTNCTSVPIDGLPHGRYCVLLQTGLALEPPYPGPMVATAIAQTGTVPGWANTIVFNAGFVSILTNVAVTFSGTPVPLAVLSNAPNYWVVGGDVSRFAGQTGELRFTAPILWNGSPPRPSWNALLLDYVRFSTSPLGAAPVILSGPANQSANMGSTVHLAVSASGWPMPAYQWWFNTTNLMAAGTNPVLELVNVQFAQSGAYTVVVTNLYGTATSAPAYLTVYDPFIISQPTGQSANAGQTIGFSVQAGGTLPLSFQWLKDGQVLKDGGKISGAATANLTLSNVLGADGGGYSVLISNVYSSLSSVGATLSVRDPLILSQPGNQSVNRGGTAVFSVLTAGTPPYVYQWFDASARLNDGGNIWGAQTATLTVSNVVGGDADAYFVTISNAYGSVTSQMAFVNVALPHYLVLHSFNQIGANEDLTVSGNTLYGTAEMSVFKMNTDGTGFQAIHPIERANGGLVLSGATIYGASYSGENAPSPDYGEIYKVNTDGSGFAVLKSFSGGNDGGLTWAAPVLSGSKLYGTTMTDGNLGGGNVFSLNTDGSGFAVLKDFPYTTGLPQGGLAMSGSTLYGTLTYDYVSGIAGKVFKLNTDGSNFGILKDFGGPDGRYPLSGLVLSGTTLYGMTYYGGAASPGIGYGTVFKLGTDGGGFQVLQNFGGGSDGANPAGDLVLSDGVLFGTTSGGGISNYGTLFRIGTDGSGYSVLKRFRGSDGANPSAGLVLSGTTLYGTTQRGGPSDRGVVFAFSLAAHNILAQPQSQTAEAGSPVIFEVMVEDEPLLVYQWFFNGTNTVSDATTNPCVRLPAVQYWQAGAYCVVVSNAFGAVTSAPAMLSVIAPVMHRIVPALAMSGPGDWLNVENADTLGPSANWSTLDTVVLTNGSQWYFDAARPLAQQRFYRLSQPGGVGPPPVLSAHLAPAITLTGAPGQSVRLDYINQFGPVDAWGTLGTVTLTNSPQLFFDTSAIGQPPRLWRTTAVP